MSFHFEKSQPSMGEDINKTLLFSKIEVSSLDQRRLEIKIYIQILKSRSLTRDGGTKIP